MKRIFGRTSRKFFLSLGLVLVALAFAGATWSRSQQTVHHAAQPDAATKARLTEAYGQLPLSFEANVGQTDPQVDFISRGSGYTLFLTPGEAVLALRAAEASPTTADARNDHELPAATVLRIKFIGS